MSASAKSDSAKLDPSVLEMDCGAEAESIARRLVDLVGRTLRRRGVVVALSGGVDSSVCVALAVKAFGPDRVQVLLLPERESSAASLDLGRRVCARVGVDHTVQDITAPLEAIGAYRARDEAIREVFPDYGDEEGWRSKIVISGGLDGGLNFFKIVVQSPSGERREARLPPKPYLQIVAAQNYKQRLRKTIEYFHGDRLNYAVVGTPNRLEYDQGFFVKNGDGSADVKPIAHLYKTQVFALARHFGLPEEICGGRPTTDTYSLPQGQDEFYFSLPYEQMDLALYAFNHGLPADALAQAIGLSPAQAALVYRDIQTKRSTTRILHSRAVLVSPVPEIVPF
jgi:NAD+ synthase